VAIALSDWLSVRFEPMLCSMRSTSHGSLSVSHTHTHMHIRSASHVCIKPLRHLHTALVRSSSICGCVRSRVCRAQHPSLLRLYCHSKTHASGCQSGGNPVSLFAPLVFFLTIFAFARCTLTHALGVHVLHTLRRLRPGQTDFCVRATVLPSFGYRRSWCFRSNTGFTALGICPGGLDDGEGGQSPRSHIESCPTPSSLSTHLLLPCTSKLSYPL